MNIPFVATIEEMENGKLGLVYDLPERFQVHLMKLKEGTRVTHAVKKFFKARTPKQMGYFFGYCLPITMAFMGYARHERDQCYLALKSLYLEAIDEKGNKYVKSLAWNSDDPVDTKLMNWFIDQVRDMVAMQYGYNIKDPEKDKSLRLEEVEDLVNEIERM